MGRASRGGRSVLSRRRSGQRDLALNARQCTAPRVVELTCSHRPRRSLDWSEHPRLRAVALLPWCYLSSLACATGFLYTPVSPSKHPEFLCKPLALQPLLPPLPHFGSTVKAVTPCSSLQISCSSCSLVVRRVLTLGQFGCTPAGWS